MRYKLIYGNCLYAYFYSISTISYQRNLTFNHFIHVFQISSFISCICSLMLTILRQEKNTWIKTHMYKSTHVYTYTWTYITRDSCNVGGLRDFLYVDIWIKKTSKIYASSLSVKITELQATHKYKEKKKSS